MMCSLLPHDITGPSNLPEQPCTCRERRNQHRNTKDVKNKKFSLRLNATGRATVGGQESIPPLSRSRFTEALRRLRRRSGAVPGTMSCRCMCQAKHTVLTMTVPDDNVRKRASKDLGGLVNMQH
jgi:hypothetical protein